LNATQSGPAGTPQSEIDTTRRVLIAAAQYEMLAVERRLRLRSHVIVDFADAHAECGRLCHPLLGQIHACALLRHADKRQKLNSGGRALSARR
jgi:hypothetical protein